MTPFEAALSSARVATWASSVALAASPASAASRKRRTEVRRADLVALLRNRAFSLVLIRLIWDLMFATGQASIAWGVVQKISVGRTHRRRADATAHISSVRPDPSNCRAGFGPVE